MRKTEHAYWEDLWRTQRGLAPPLMLHGYHGSFNRQVLDVVLRAAQRPNHPVTRLIEVGCGNSTWLPLLARELHVDQADGLDYSEEGCQRARAILQRENTSGTIYKSDLFEPPHGLLHQYDLGVSFGVVEHFADTAECLRAIGRLVRPQGLVVTFVPNFAGWMGRLQAWLDPEVFHMHVPLNAQLLATAHHDAGLEIVDAGYLATLSLGVVSARRLHGSVVGLGWRAATAAVGRAAYALRQLKLPSAGPRLSPHAFCVATVR